MSIRRMILAATLIALVLPVSRIVASDNPVSPAPASIASLKPQIVAQSRVMLGYLHDKATPTDPQFYAAGVWHFTNDACHPCQVGPASLAAALYVADGRHPADLALANETVDAAVKTYQNPNGSLGDPTNPDPIFFLHEIGFTCDTLRGALDPVHAAQCVQVLTRGADWLVSSGNSKWYANGNIVAMQVAVFSDAWRVTGQARFLDQYETELRFLVNPPQSGQSNGFGLRYAVGPHRPDGTDGAAYITEKGTAAPGYDPEYSHFQLSILGRLYASNRDARILRIANLLFNQEWARTDHATMILDATNGSRHNLKFPFWTGATYTLSWLGGREDTTTILADQWRLATLPTFLGNARDNWSNPGLYRGYGVELGQMLLATMDERLR